MIEGKWGVAHIYSSFNNTIIHITDITGAETIARYSGGTITDKGRLQGTPFPAMQAAKKAAEDLYQQISGISTTHPTSSSNNSNTSNFWSDYGWIIGVGIAVLLIPPIFLAIRVIVKKKV